MMILALDLTSASGSIVVRADGTERASLDLDSQDGFAHLIFPAIQSALDAAGVSADEIDCFAAASGPGAFTGVRVGLAAIKGLAAAYDRPVAGVSNLRALSTFGAGSLRAAVIDARRGDCFAGLFDGMSEMLGEETVMPLVSWIGRLPKPLPEFVVQDPKILEQAASLDHLRVVTAPKRLATAIAVCAERDGERGLWLDPAALDANYVRRSDAELHWKEPA